jgi:uncharacterized protein
VPRRVCCQVTARGFRPVGRPPCKADAITIGLDEFEAIRLADVEGLYQDAAAARMGVSRQTYARILNRARASVARCLVDGKMLLVGSGDSDPIVEGPAPPLACPIHGGRHRRGRKCRCAGADSTCTPACGRQGRGPSS